MGKNLLIQFVCITTISALVLVFSGESFSEESKKASEEKAQSAEGEQEVNINQIAFIVKFDKNGDGKLDNNEFTGSHFPQFDKNGDGFIEAHEAPAGETAY
jgi:hypothetical protein